jgi:hypothetical protein
MVTMQGYTPILIRRARKDGLHKFPVEFVLRIEAAFGRPQDFQGDWRETMIMEESLMRGSIVDTTWKVSCNALNL